MRYRSEARAALYAEKRIPLVERLLRERPRCEARVQCTGAPTVDVHEILSRGRGGAIVDLPDEAFLCVCRDCHSWITTHDAKAKCAGFTLPSWAFNHDPDAYAAAAALRERSGTPCPWRDATRPCGSDDPRQQGACQG